MRATDFIREQYAIVERHVNAILEPEVQGDPAEAAGLRRELAARYRAVASAALHFLYPACGDAVGEGAVLELDESHRVLEFALERLLEATPGTPVACARAAVLRRALATHLEGGELALLAAADAALPAERLEELGALMRARVERDLDALRAPPLRLVRGPGPASSRPTTVTVDVPGTRRRASG